MAEVILKNVRKIYPISSNESKRRKEIDREENKNEVGSQRTNKGIVAVEDFNLKITDKEFVVLVGPSGCGKSTTLRMIAGLEEITDGELYINDKIVNDVAPKDRDIAMVFQNYALYPHMTVYENMAFALRLRKEKKEIIDAKVRQAAEILDITELLKRKPKALSGGQRQRVAIGRAIVRNPQVFLMDEPLSNLDAKLRNQMRAELIKLRQRINTTFIYVTHDQTEAMTLGDRIVVMKDGFIQQTGTPQEVFDHPVNLFVAGFIGTPQMNLLKNARLSRDDEKYYVTVFNQRIELHEEMQEALKLKKQEEKDVIIGVRPVHIILTENGGTTATLDVIEMMGSELYLHLNVEGAEVIAIVPTTGTDIRSIHSQQTVQFTFQPELMHVFNKETGLNILYPDPV